jgi:hypothetical protein
VIFGAGRVRTRDPTGRLYLGGQPQCNCCALRPCRGGRAIIYGLRTRDPRTAGPRCLGRPSRWAARRRALSAVPDPSAPYLFSLPSCFLPCSSQREPEPPPTWSSSAISSSRPVGVMPTPPATVTTCPRRARADRRGPVCGLCATLCWSPAAAKPPCSRLLKLAQGQGDCVGLLLPGVCWGRVEPGLPPEGCRCRRSPGRHAKLPTLVDGGAGGR